MEEERNETQVKYCNLCGEEMPENAKFCPNCGGKKKKPFYKRVSFWVIVVALALLLMPGSDEEEVAAEPENAGTEIEDIAKPAEPTEPEEPAEPEVPREFRAALNSAEFYSEEMNMSKKAIYEQLVSEYGDQFPAEAAQYAVDHLVADYHLNALESAKIYRDEMDMSTNAIYDQLVSEYGEQFTAEEAQYAIDHLDE